MRVPSIWTALAALALAGEALAVVQTGEPAPDFTLEALGGGQVSLGDFRGKVVLINLFGYN
jgi:peroxiredoxin